MPICQKCNKYFPVWFTINGKKRNLSNRKYCLDCSPFNKHNTKKLGLTVKELIQCKKCGKIQPISNFYLKNGKVRNYYCKKCFNSYCTSKKQKLKEKAINYCGVKCIICGYNKTTSALCFHHVDPATKDHTLTKMLNRSWKNTIKELDKCVLLCVRCHEELHHSDLKEHHQAIINDYLKNKNIQ